MNSSYPVTPSPDISTENSGKMRESYVVMSATGAGLGLSVSIGGIVLTGNVSKSDGLHDTINNLENINSVTELNLNTVLVYSDRVALQQSIAANTLQIESLQADVDHLHVENLESVAAVVPIGLVVGVLLTAITRRRRGVTLGRRTI